MLRRLLMVGSVVAGLGVGLVAAQTPPASPPGTPPRTAPGIPPGTQPGTPPGTAPGVRVEQPVGAETGFRAKTLLGSKVFIQGNTEMGTVDDIVFSHEGVIQYLVVAHEGKMVTVPWEAARFDWNKRAATVNITQEQFRAIPTYTVDRYPDYFAPTYRTEVFRWYSLTPGQERRLERQANREERREERRP